VPSVGDRSLLLQAGRLLDPSSTLTRVRAASYRIMAPGTQLYPLTRPSAGAKYSNRYSNPLGTGANSDVRRRDVSSP
jgi:hypothetical protein